ncbi:MAG: hypothetical protein LBO06_07955 [Bacteroidales bacterium]|jgi:hypothetical protein|nr:hypothetical protein [Bacteroidales bacterium]
MTKKSYKCLPHFNQTPQQFSKAAFQRHETPLRDAKAAFQEIKAAFG